MEQVTANVPDDWYQRWRKRVENGECDSISEAVRYDLRQEKYDTSRFRSRCDQLATAAGLVGIAMMGMALFMPLVFRLVALAPIGISLALYAAGYVHDSRNGVTEAHA